MRDRSWWDAAYRLIDAERHTYRIGFMCEMLGISTSGYYRWRKREPSRRARDDAALGQVIQQLFDASSGTYGIRRIHAGLRHTGWDVGRSRVTRLMHRMGLLAVQPHRRRVTTQGTSDHVSDDHVNRGFGPSALDQIWVADATYLPTSEGVLYLAVVMDSASRRILGWALSVQQTADLMCDALRAALQQRPDRTSPVIHHSDRGSQYTSTEFRELCEAEGVIQSMGRTGNCYDNAQIESFFASLKKECVSKLHLPDRATIKRRIIRWIEAWYNPRRLHSQLDYLSPNAFEQRVRAVTQDRMDTSS